MGWLGRALLPVKFSLLDKENICCSCGVLRYSTWDLFYYIGKMRGLRMSLSFSEMKEHKRIHCSLHPL